MCGPVPTSLASAEGGASGSSPKKKTDVSSIFHKLNIETVRIRVSEESESEESEPNSIECDGDELVRLMFASHKQNKLQKHVLLTR